MVPEVVAAPSAEYAFQEAQAFAQSVRGSKAKRQYRHYWERAIARLKAVVAKYPQSPRAVQAQFLIGRLYTEMAAVSYVADDVDNALAAYRKLVRDYPSNRLADDAQYAIGEIYLERKRDRTGAYVEFEKVVTLYPRGDMTAKAKARLAELADAKPSPSLSKGTLVHVNRVLHWSNPDYTRIAIYLGERTQFKYGFLPEDNKAQKPRRLYIDILNARLDASLKEPIPIQDGLLLQARAAQFNSDTVRVVLDMASVGDYRVFALVSPFRIIVDVYGANSGSAADATATASEPRVLPSPKPEIAAQPELRNVPRDAAKVPFSRQLGLQIRRVVIDAGHGGHDPGAIGIGKLYEKEVTLKIAKRLAPKLRKKLNVETVLTRDDDSFVQLEGRPGIARAKGGDLFISIHCNSSPVAGAFGIETYHLDLTNDRNAIAVAARENASSEASVSEQEEILRDLMLTSKRHDSIELARAIQRSLIKQLGTKYDGIKDLGVKGAPFVVLIGANIPAVLIEVGFVSNPREAKRLRDERYLDAVADAVVSGVETYIANLRATTF